MPFPIVNLSIVIRNVTCDVVKLLVERQSHIIYVKVGMFIYGSIRESDYLLVFVMVFGLVSL